VRKDDSKPAKREACHGGSCRDHRSLGTTATGRGDPLDMRSAALLLLGVVGVWQFVTRGGKEKALESTFRSSYGHKTHRVSSWGARLPSLGLA
jgi:hypothetical protein